MWLQVNCCGFLAAQCSPAGALGNFLLASGTMSESWCPECQGAAPASLPVQAPRCGSAIPAVRLWVLTARAGSLSSGRQTCSVVQQHVSWPGALRRGLAWLGQRAITAGGLASQSCNPQSWAMAEGMAHLWLQCSRQMLPGQRREATVGTPALAQPECMRAQQWSSPSGDRATCSGCPGALGVERPMGARVHSLSTLPQVLISARSVRRRSS